MAEQNPQTRPSSDVSLDQLIRLYVEKRLGRLHTWLPGRVVSVVDARTVTVQPEVKWVMNGQAQSYPPIPDCRVYVPASATCDQNVPCGVGTTGMLSFSERPLEAWMVQGREVEPTDGRIHHIQDAVFLPGLWSDVDVPAGSLTNWWVKIDGTGLTIQADGKTRLDATAQHDLIAPIVKVRTTDVALTTHVLKNGTSNLQVMLANALTELAAAATALSLPTINTAALIVALNNEVFSANNLFAE